MPFVGVVLRVPSFDNPDLAYETGVHLGDGSLDQYRYVISGDRTKELQYCQRVLAPLVQRLYGLVPALAFEHNSIYLRIYSKELVAFKHDVLGLPIGVKKHIRFPSFSKQNDTSISNVISGLYDTDGSAKVRHNRSGDYPRISLAQKHPELVLETKALLESFGITSTFYRNDYADPRSGKIETRWFLDINGFRNFDLFIFSIGTRSPYMRERLGAIDGIR